ncbi:hypothetical protein QE152_g39531 [Popillia japonica]|uniref:Uncharacterized protein n=1 Tax=Popillia japonica TaxID=7064 RepID=A0AAW1HTZ1_POPJA
MNDIQLVSEIHDTITLDRMVQEFTDKIREVADRTTEIHDTITLDRMVQEFTDKIREVADRTIPLKTVNPFRYNELPLQVAELIKERNRLRKHFQRFQRTRDQDTRREANALTTTIRQMILKHTYNERLRNNDTYNERLRNINPYDGSIWKLNRHLRLERRQISVIEDENDTPAFRDQDIAERPAFRDQDIAERIATAFEQYHNTPETTPQTEHLVNNTIHNYFLNKPIDPNTTHDFLTSPAEIKRLIKLSPSLKAPGPDGIQNILLKNLPRKAIVQITYLFNAAIKPGYKIYY